MPDSTSSWDGASPFLGRVRAACRRKGYTYRAEKTYLRWIVRYVKHHGTQHPRAFGRPEVREYLSSLATERNAAASPPNQALNALLGQLQRGRALWPEDRETGYGRLRRGLDAESPRAEGSTRGRSER